MTCLVNVFKETHGQYVVSNTFIVATLKGGLEFFYQNLNNFLSSSQEKLHLRHIKIFLKILLIKILSARLPVPFITQTGALLVTAPATLFSELLLPIKIRIFQI